MTKTELKEKVTEHGNAYFFTHDTMKFFGDTMANYGVRSAIVEEADGSEIHCWELYRRRPVKHGLQQSVYFRKDNFKKAYPKAV